MPPALFPTAMIALISVLQPQGNSSQFRWEANEPFAIFKGNAEEREKLINDVLLNTNAIDSHTIYIAANTAFRSKRHVDAAFLYYVARMRAYFDINVFMSSKGGSSHPSVYLGFLDSNAKQEILPWLYTHYDDFILVSKRLSDWDSEVISNYKPGWAFEGKPLTKFEGMSRNEFKNKYLEFMTSMSKLFTIPEYRQAYNDINPYLVDTDKLLSTHDGKKKHEKALALMTTIEKQNNIKGFALTQ